jgi:hypothetical protein
MAFQLSPGVQVTEKDFTSVVPAVGASIGGFAGEFRWGPANEVVTVSSENELLTRFGKPPVNNKGWFSAASFLAYTNTLKVVRAVNSASRNAGSTAGVLITNEDDYDDNHSTGEGNNGMWAAKYAGVLGNSIRVEMADSAGPETGGGATLTTIAIGGTGGQFTCANANLIVGTRIIITGTLGGTGSITGYTSGTVYKVSAITGTAPAVTGFTLTTMAGTAIVTTAGTPTGLTVKAGTAYSAWTYASQFDYTPSATTSVTAVGGSNDELHIIVVDIDGAISGTAGTILERFAGVSKASDARDSLGRSNFYKNVINTRSEWIWWTDHPAAATSTDAWGISGVGKAFTSSHVFSEGATTLTGGVDGATEAPTITDSDKQTAFDLFANDELVDVNLIFVGDASLAVGDYVIDNIAEVRKDCMVFVSPEETSVVNNVGGEAAAIVTDLATFTRSSYAVMDSGYKYMYDRYNDAYVYVPLNGDIAGLCAKTDADADPWFSPAGYNRGAIKNAVKLAYSPNKSDRDTLYKNGINPVVGFPGSGIVLFGDKTMLAKPSAFDRINVRRLFITLEKAIATAAKFQLFEFNDAFTRAQFKNLVDPFLRDVQGRRGIFNFRTVCDETNNTSQVIDSNSFVADIFIQPARSINFIQLNFIATRTGISFDEVGG